MTASGILIEAKDMCHADGGTLILAILASGSLFETQSWFESFFCAPTTTAKGASIPR